jgi:hypothetical protein
MSPPLVKLLKWLALPALILLVVYVVLTLGTSGGLFAKKCCSGCGAHRNGAHRNGAHRNGTLKEGFEEPTVISHTSTDLQNADGTIPYLEKDTGPGSPAQKAYQATLDQNKKQNSANLLA